MGKFYEYRTIVTIADTNLFQHMDFGNYFVLQGIVRELWVKDAVVNGIESMMDIFLITKTAHCDFVKDFYIFDEIDRDSITNISIPLLTTNTIMNSPQERVNLAKSVLNFLQST